MNRTPAPSSAGAPAGAVPAKRTPNGRVAEPRTEPQPSSQLQAEGRTAEGKRPRSALPEELCGNSRVDPGEACDDGNQEWGDGCSGICTAEAVDLVLGGGTACVLTNQGTVKCWGNNNAAQLGIGDLENRGTLPGQMGRALPAVTLGTDVRAKALAVARSHTCAVLQGGGLKCWGRNCEAQLGLPVPPGTHTQVSCSVLVGDDPSEMGDHLPVVALGPVPVQSVVAGLWHTCALLVNGSVKCWGWNSGGALGCGGCYIVGDDPREMGATLPTVPLGAHKADELVGNSETVCATLDDGRVHCWGGLPKHVALSRGGKLYLGSRHFCTLSRQGAVRCWGYGDAGQLGYAYLRPDEYDQIYLKAPPGDIVHFGRGRRAVSLALGTEHTCALLDDATITCWGSNEYGALGDGHADDADCFSSMSGRIPCRMAPATKAVDLGTGSKPRKLVATGGANCVLFENARIKCWGSNGHGVLGLGDTKDRDRPPEQWVLY